MLKEALVGVHLQLCLSGTCLRVSGLSKIYGTFGRECLLCEWGEGSHVIATHTSCKRVEEGVRSSKTLLTALMLTHYSCVVVTCDFPCLWTSGSLARGWFNHPGVNSGLNIHTGNVSLFPICARCHIVWNNRFNPSKPSGGDNGGRNGGATGKMNNHSQHCCPKAGDKRCRGGYPARRYSLISKISCWHTAGEEKHPPFGF